MPEFLTAQLIALGASQTLASAIVNLGISAAFSAVSAALNRSSGSDLSRELAAPNTNPPYRHAYGRARIQGSWAPGWEPFYDEANDILYACIILNSRPSAGGVVRLFADRRAIGLAGDPYDFGELESGTATVLEGNTTVVVSHGLTGTPTLAQAWTDDGAYKTTGTLTATEMTITIPEAAPSGGTEVNWMAGIATDGAAATNTPFSGHFNAWIGLGDQGHPPVKVLQEWGDLAARNGTKFWPSDKWTNCTVLWLKITEGEQETLAERWPSWPPAIEAEMNWSLVWDPRDAGQDEDDPTTWAYSDNQALCLLGALRQNPVERYPLTGIRVEDFEDAADLADEAVALKNGGSQKRYVAGGIVAYSQGAELFQQLQPLAMAGAGELVKIGGRVGYRPGAYQTPTVTVTEAMRGPMRFTGTRNPRDLPGAIRCRFPDPASSWEMTSLIAREVDPAWDGSDERIRGVDLGMVPVPQQAMRIQKILAEQAKLQKSLSFTAPPSAIELVAGGTVTIDFPRAGDVRNGIYRVTGTDPAQWMQGDGGAMAFAMPVDLVETASTVYAWTPATDEDDFYVADDIPADPGMSAPLSLDATVDGTDIDVDIGPPGILVTDPNPIWFADSDVPQVEWEFRRNDEGFWQGGGTLNNTAQTVSGILSPVASGESYDFRARSVNGARFSTWVYDYAVQVGFTMAAPNTASATAGSGEIALSATSPDDSDFDAIQFWASDTDDFEAANLLSEQSGAQDTVFTHTDTGLLTGQTRYYFIRALTADRAVSAFATASATAL